MVTLILLQEIYMIWCGKHANMYSNTIIDLYGYSSTHMNMNNIKWGGVFHIKFAFDCVSMLNDSFPCNKSIFNDQFGFQNKAILT